MLFFFSIFFKSGNRVMHSELQEVTHKSVTELGPEYKSSEFPSYTSDSWPLVILMKN